jgi:hypothetical protein
MYADEGEVKKCRNGRRMFLCRKKYREKAIRIKKVVQEKV